MSGRPHDATDGVHLSFLGGPLHRLGCRLGLIRNGFNTVPIGLVLGVGAWIVLAVLATLNGNLDRLFSISVVGTHVRLLVAIPLLFLGETLLDPRQGAFVRLLLRGGVMPPGERPAFEADIARITRWKDSWIPDVLFLVVVIAWSLSGARVGVTGVSGIAPPMAGSQAVAPGAAWYWYVCLPLFRFVLLRWLWRLILWIYFLGCTARRRLHLVPTHPDGAAGLGYLEVVHTHFIPAIVALSAVQAASLAEEIVAGNATIESIYPAFAMVLLVVAGLFLAPLFLLAPKLWAARVKGHSDYMELADRYVSGFEGKWVKGAHSPDDELLGTGDIQSLADLNNSLGVVRNMRPVPISLRLITDFAIAALVPILPVLLLAYPLDELIRKFIARMGGL